MFTKTVVFCLFIGAALASPATELLSLTNLEECEGKDAANFSLVTKRDGASESNDLLQCNQNGQKAVNSLRTLAQSRYPAGAYTQEDTLSLVTTGPLQGKYVYVKVIRLVEDYLKKRSSVLGYSYVTSKSAQLLINNNLDINVLISPTGGYESFKKGCNTICNGRQVTV